MNLKALFEKRNELVERMQALVDAAKEETRAFSEEEKTEFEAKKEELRALDETIRAAEEAEKLEKREIDDKEKETAEEAETRAFEQYLRGAALETRADLNLTKGDNGAVIPQTIANKIIETVKELSHIYSMATVYHVKGDLLFPVWGDDEDGNNISCAYAEEFVDLESKSGRFTSVKLSGFLAGALTKISKSLINNSQFDIVSFVVRKVAEAISEFIERELICGTEGKMTGILSAEVGTTTASSTAITADEIIDLTMSMPEQYANRGCFIMHKTTLAALRKLKNQNGDYLLSRDITNPFGWTILGRPVHITETMPQISAGSTPIIFGDMSGLYVKVTENMQLQMLNELYATQHAIGVVGWLEMDSKIIEPQKIRALTMKAA